MSTLDSIRSSLNSPRALLAAYERYGAWLPKAVSLLLTIVLARLAAELVWILVPQPAASAWQPPPSAPSAATAKGVDLNAIAAANLFGQYQPQHTDAVDAKHARETTLNLTLLGVFAWDQQHSRAIIEPQGSEAKPFAIGDTVVAGATLQQVLADRVILLRNGRPEALKLKKGASEGDTETADTDNSGADNGSDEDQANADEEPANSVSEVRNVLLSDPSRAAEFIRVMPLNAGNGLNGYRVYPGPDRTLFTGTGLRPGDVVTAVNGVQLNDPARAIQMLGDLAHTNNLSITVNRGGTNQNIQVNLNQ